MYHKIVNLPHEWKGPLERIANEMSFKLGVSVSVSDVIRNAVSKEHKLELPPPSKRGRPAGGKNEK